LTVSTESDFKYRGFIEDWNTEEILLKYVGSEIDDRCVVIRWLPVSTITEVAYVRESDLDEAWMSNDHESSLRFADENPGDMSNTIIEEIFEDFDDYDYLEGAA
jgi:hypothetical protein